MRVFQLGEYTIGELKKTLAGKKPKYRDINRYQSEDKLPNILPSDKKKTTFVEKHFSNILTFRQELRLEPRGKPLKNEDTLDSLGIKTGALLYFKVQAILFHSSISRH